MARVVVTGAAGPLGRKVRTLLADRDDVSSVVGIDLLAVTGRGVEEHRLDLVTADLDEAFAGADAVLHLASAFGPRFEGPEIEAAADVTMARRVLDAAGKAGAGTVVLLSSATVYGPWPNNPVPITEEAPLRPHPDLAFAVQMAEIERLAAEWSAGHPSTTVARLRPATVVGSDGSWLAEALDAVSGLPPGEETPAQYLHIDDLAAAVVVAFAQRLDGPVNVAPSGWLTPTERQALDPIPKLRLPENAALKAADLRWRLGLAPTTPGVVAYARHPWVVANDRLVAAGWAETNSNEEAYVAGHEASAIEKVSPQRRQELALGVSAGVIAAVVGGIVAVVRHRRRR
ncbi:MAG: NAD-dependent epimerase/dehydratase family protein [Acidimicrobiales bacterium]|nr:NAD-dependent epimerase/dehydratase family protein [Acidimicrobiales bacterium]